jgi:hypothetical protein
VEQGGASPVLVHLDQLARTPLRTCETVINLIGNTTNRGGLVARVRLDRRRYPTGRKISKKELRELKVECEEFHGEWNYVIRSRMEQR